MSKTSDLGWLRAEAGKLLVLADAAEQPCAGGHEQAKTLEEQCTPCQSVTLLYEAGFSPTYGGVGRGIAAARRYADIAQALIEAEKALEAMHKAAVVQHPDFGHDLHGRTALKAYDEALTKIHKLSRGG